MSGCMIRMLISALISITGGLPAAARHSLLLFEFTSRGDVIVRTVPFAGGVGFTAQQYADALAARPEMDYGCTTTSVHLRKLQTTATVRGDAMTVNYHDPSFTTLSTSSETFDFCALFNAWYWVPGVRRLYWQHEGKSVTAFSELDIGTQPFTYCPCLFGYHPGRNELIMSGREDAFHTDGTTLRQMLIRLNARESPGSPGDGVEPLLPPGMAITANVSNAVMCSISPVAASAFNTSAIS